MNIYNRMIDLMQSRLVNDGMQQDAAIRVSALAVDGIRGEMGGMEVYLPKGRLWMTRSQRNRLIRNEYNGRNMTRMCGRYELSRASIYRICKKK